MLTRSECKSSAEVIQFLTIYPNASCLPTPSSEFMNSAATINSSSPGLTSNSSAQASPKSPLFGEVVLLDSIGGVSSNNNKEGWNSEPSSPQPVHTSSSNNATSNNNNNTPKKSNSNPSIMMIGGGGMTLKKLMNQNKLVQQELDQGYGYTWFTYNKQHNKLNDFKPPNDDIILKDKFGNASVDFARHNLFDMSDLSSRTLFREGLHVNEAWQVRSKAASNMIKQHWFSSASTNKSYNNNNNNHFSDSGRDSASSGVASGWSQDVDMMSSLACFWLDFHYCVFIHQHEVS
jgi:hypothetical protein